MDEFLALGRDTRIRVCEETGARRGISATAIEKDFWVCWTLRALFSLPEIGENLTFKGGTSLSKGWQLIGRFSEDIDVVVARKLLGFDEGNLSGGQIKKLRRRCSTWIREKLLPELRENVESLLSTKIGWYIELAELEDDSYVVHRLKV